jgi:LacI family transcriptional regulator
VSVIGYSNVKVSQLTTPYLTTVAQPFELMGARGAKVLVDLISKPQSTDCTIEVLPTKLIIRDSATEPANAKSHVRNASCAA